MDEDPRNAASPVVRCELALPPSTGSEAERALRAKEGRCFLCTRCSEGGGCPSNVGTWYSDSYTTSLSGCRLQDGKYLAHRVGLNMNPGDKVRSLLGGGWLVGWWAAAAATAAAAAVTACLRGVLHMHGAAPDRCTHAVSAAVAPDAAGQV